MAERDKRDSIISHLQILRTWCAVSPDFGKGLSIDDCHKAVEWLDDALELLNEQEPLQIVKAPRYVEHGKCPECGQIVNKSANFCWNCGRAVKWID